MKPLRVLVAHRNAAQGDELAELLRRGDHTARAVSSTSAAAELMGNDADTLLLDLDLPDLDLAALRRALGSLGEGEPDSLDAAERRHIARVLQFTAGNKRRAAHILGISRSTLLHKVRKYGLEAR
jgi:DNA-binding NtrC family response regulator